MYIGQTRQEPTKRFQQHLNAAFNDEVNTYNTCLSRAIRKHGKDSFTLGLLAEDVPDEELDAVEAHYIDMYQSNNPEHGYNISSGYNDNSMADIYHNMEPDDDYSDKPIVDLDEIDDDEIEKILEELNNV